MTKRLVILLFPLAIMATPAVAGMITISAAGGAYNLHVTSIKEARFDTTVRQQYDFSCGSAALATLLTYHYEDSVTESEVFNAMFEKGDQDKIRTAGFSLLDIKKYLLTRGYSSNGFRTSLDKLASLGVPAIVLINHNGYRHFVVIKGIVDGNVLLGDPSLGIRTVSREEFEPMWNGLLFLILNQKNIANRNFNKDKEWNHVATAPFDSALKNKSLAKATWMLRPPSDF